MIINWKSWKVGTVLGSFVALSLCAIYVFDRPSTQGLLVASLISFSSSVLLFLAWALYIAKSRKIRAALVAVLLYVIGTGSFFAFSECEVLNRSILPPAPHWVNGHCSFLIIKQVWYADGQGDFYIFNRKLTWPPAMAQCEAKPEYNSEDPLAEWVWETECGIAHVATGAQQEKDQASALPSETEKKHVGQREKARVMRDKN